MATGVARQGSAEARRRQGGLHRVHPERVQVLVGLVADRPRLERPGSAVTPGEQPAAPWQAAAAQHVDHDGRERHGAWLAALAVRDDQDRRLRRPPDVLGSQLGDLGGSQPSERGEQQHRAHPLGRRGEGEGDATTLGEAAAMRDLLIDRGVVAPARRRHLRPGATKAPPGLIPGGARAGGGSRQRVGRRKHRPGLHASCVLRTGWCHGSRSSDIWPGWSGGSSMGS